MAISPGERPVKVLVYCPDEGGWNVGEWIRAGYYEGTWFRQGWRLAADHDLELRPTHWLPYPEEPCRDRAERYAVELHLV